MGRHSSPLPPTKEQLALIKQCTDLWGAGSVKTYGPDPLTGNMQVKCQGKAGVHRMTYAADGRVLASSFDMTMVAMDLDPPKPRNAQAN